MSWICSSCGTENSDKYEVCTVCDEPEVATDPITMNSKEEVHKVVMEWKHFWMNQRQNSEEDYQNYFRRAFGVDANMAHHLSTLIYRRFRKSEVAGPGDWNKDIVCPHCFTTQEDKISASQIESGESAMWGCEKCEICFEVTKHSYTKFKSTKVD